MIGVPPRQVPRDVYNRARDKGRLEVFFNTFLRKDVRIPTLEKVLDPYTYEVEKTPYWVGYIWPHRLTGTINIDRRYCFSRSYYPLPHFDSGDFAHKWARVMRETERWLDYPIDCFEFLHKYYVKEGNKRASVSRYLDLPGIMVNITRVIPMNYEREDVRSYHEFLSFERQTGIGCLWFSHEGAFAKLTALMNKHHLSGEDLITLVFNPYCRITGNYSGPYDEIIDYLSIFPGRDASSKYREKAFKQVILARKHKRKAARNHAERLAT